MVATRVTRWEISRLASKLEQLGPALSESDRAVLGTVFALAAAAISNTTFEAGSGVRSGGAVARGPAAHAERAANGDLPPLSAGFKGAFQPGTGACFTLENRTPADMASKRPALKVRLVESAAP
jgi:hypothetical protein